VAATRARDLLVVPAIGDEERDGWLAPLNKAIYPARDKWRQARSASYISFKGIRTVLDRPLDSVSQDEPSIKPGLHTPQCGKHEVVWWDPEALKLIAPENFGLRQVDILEAQGEAAASIEQYKAWQAARADMLEQGQAKDFDIVIATGLTEAPPEAPAVTVESIGQAAGRPRGVRFGALLHGILRDTDLAAAREQVDELASMHGKLLGATQQEIASAADAVLAVLSHPLLARARTAQQCHREMPVLLPLADGKTLEGVMDLAFLENGEWTVLDFKTDAEISTSQSRYERQVQWYAHALSRLTGLAARGVLLRA
jgi:ATP-dependent helicase/nuclease subunit A